MAGVGLTSAASVPRAEHGGTDFARIVRSEVHAEGPTGPVPLILWRHRSPPWERPVYEPAPKEQPPRKLSGTRTVTAR